MARSAVATQGRLILFGRYPVPGQTKTRLIPALGALGAAELQRQLTLCSLNTLEHSTLPSTTFYYTGGSLTQVQRWLGHRPINFRKQQGLDLGARMRAALFATLDRDGGPVVLVGSDIAQMAAHHLTRAFDALARHDVVLGPSRDGGYWLVGLRRPVDIFSNIQWSTPNVWEQTLAAIQNLGLSHAALPMLNDIDTPSDLRQWLPEAQWPRPYLSVIIPTLNEAANISATIDRVRRHECEIIVADGGSTDRTADLARAAGAKVISTARSRARQQNRAAEIGAGVLLFLHADTRLPEDYGHQIFETLMASSVTAGAFKFKTDYDNWRMRWIERAVHLRATRFQMPYGDQGLFMRRSTFKKAGRFEEVPIAEDLYLVRRLAKMGRIALAPGAAVTSGRRWRSIGIWRATLINFLIAGGALLGVDPARLAPLYRWGLTPCID